jgi:hypothetical protein
MKLVRGDDYDLIASMHGHVLRSLVVGAPNDLAEARLGILKHPMAAPRAAHGLAPRSGTLCRSLVGASFGHSD